MSFGSRACTATIRPTRLGHSTGAFATSAIRVKMLVLLSSPTSSKSQVEPLQTQWEWLLVEQSCQLLGLICSDEI